MAIWPSILKSVAGPKGKAERERPDFPALQLWNETSAVAGTASGPASDGCSRMGPSSDGGTRTPDSGTPRARARASSLRAALEAKQAAEAVDVSVVIQKPRSSLSAPLKGAVNFPQHKPSSSSSQHEHTSSGKSWRRAALLSLLIFSLLLNGMAAVTVWYMQYQLPPLSSVPGERRFILLTRLNSLLDYAQSHPSKTDMSIVNTHREVLSLSNLPVPRKGPRSMKEAVAKAKETIKVLAAQDAQKGALGKLVSTIYAMLWPASSSRVKQVAVVEKAKPALIHPALPKKASKKGPSKVPVKKSVLKPAPLPAVHKHAAPARSMLQLILRYTGEREDLASMQTTALDTWTKMKDSKEDWLLPLEMPSKK